MTIKYGPGGTGLTQNNPGASARGIKLQYPSSTTGLYWIQPPGLSAPIQVYCDMSTVDQFGEAGGWMLVGSWSNGYQWTLSANTSASTFNTTALNCASSNFGNQTINFFRIQSAAAVTSTGSSAAADWYYYYPQATTWKSVWAPDGSNYQYYLSSGIINNVQRTCIKPFTGSYNLKFGYNNPNHKWNNISDYGYTNTNTNGLALIGGSNASSTGFCNYWQCLTTPGYAFGVFNLSYTGSFVLGDAPTSDGSLAIPINGANMDTTGQDVDGSVAAKIGYDDAGVWYAATTNASVAVGAGDSAANTAMWWWIK
jgi:hypothetical protein